MNRRADSSTTLRNIQSIMARPDGAVFEIIHHRHDCSVDFRVLEVDKRTGMMITGYVWDCPVADDLQLLYDYLRVTGQIVKITSEIATKTIQFLKETI